MVDGGGVWSQSVFGGHHTCDLWLWRSWHFNSAPRHGARGFSLVLVGVFRRGVDDPVWCGVSTTEATRAGTWARFRSRALGSSRFGQLALLDRLSAANWRIHLFRTCCGPHFRSRSFILWNPAHDPRSEAVAAATADRHECHTLRVPQGFHARSVARRSSESR